MVYSLPSAWRRAALAIALVLLGLPLAPAAHADGCQYVLGFKTLYTLIPRIVGQCLDDQQFDPANGDALQHTTNGLLVWRKADNHTAFTDGFHTWVNGPNGLEARLNTTRFPWEPNPDRLPVVPDAYVGRQTLRVLSTTLGYVQGPLRFRVEGSGFLPGETVILRGSYRPAYLVPTGNAQAPYVERVCTAQPLGPITATPGDHATFFATLVAPNTFRTGGSYSLTATSAHGSASLGGGAAPARASVLPAACPSAGD